MGKKLNVVNNRVNSLSLPRQPPYRYRLTRSGHGCSIEPRPTGLFGAHTVPLRRSTCDVLLIAGLFEILRFGSAIPCRLHPRLGWDAQAFSVFQNMKDKNLKELKEEDLKHENRNLKELKEENNNTEKMFQLKSKILKDLKQLWQGYQICLFV